MTKVNSYLLSGLHLRYAAFWKDSNQAHFSGSEMLQNYKLVDLHTCVFTFLAVHSLVNM